VSWCGVTSGRTAADGSVNTCSNCSSADLPGTRSGNMAASNKANKQTKCWSCAYSSTRSRAECSCLGGPLASVRDNATTEPANMALGPSQHDACESFSCGRCGDMLEAWSAAQKPPTHTLLLRSLLPHVDGCGLIDGRNEGS
jgi:hypothetical protein